jgi:hypothetical protein
MEIIIAIKNDSDSPWALSLQISEFFRNRMLQLCEVKFHLINTTVYQLDATYFISSCSTSDNIFT